MLSRKLQGRDDEKASKADVMMARIVAVVSIVISIVVMGRQE